MFKKSLLFLSTASLLFASTTMCYKKNHIDPETIETVKLKGGVCNDELSVEDMKKNGYKVEDIKLSNSKVGLNYTYIFIKNDMQKVVEESKEDINSADIKAGEKIYNKTCKRCHGDGTISAYNRARPLASLNEDEIAESIRDYSLDEKDNGMAILMKPYANSLIDKDIKDVAAYIQTLKKR
ncbi:MAG: c-type cytochrome [Campylobacterota bacterium]|nr:c-type cytochrome [Campylobacterota bacterium]